MSLKRVLFAVLVPILLAARSGGVCAGEVYKCIAGDRTTFQDMPCPGGEAVEIPPAPDPAEVRAAQERAYRAHEQAQAATRRHEAAERKEAAAAARQALLREKRCQRMQMDLAKAEAKAARRRNAALDRLVALKRERYGRVCQ